MRLNFRQGLISYQADTGTPVYLQQSTTAGFVSHVMNPTPTVATVAHGGTDYLMKFDDTVDLAWNITAPVTTYLYWDIDQLTAEITRGTTTLLPVNAVVAPPFPANDQHWFDLTENLMKVWSTSKQKWIVKIRLFAGIVVGGNTAVIQMYTTGSQIGLNTPSNPGYILLDTMLKPLRKSTLNGEFLTDDDETRVLSTVGTSGVLVQPVSRAVPVRAGEVIPKMSLVYFSGADTVRLATSDPGIMPSRPPVGILMDALVTGEIGTLVQMGEISYDQWDWSASPGAPVYCDSFGQLTLTRPGGLMAFRAGYVKNANTIMLLIDSETQPQVYTVGTESLIIAGQTPISITDVVNLIGERVVTISIPDATTFQRGLMTADQLVELNSHETRLDAIDLNIIDLQTNKSNVGHTHGIADVSNLQTALNDINAALGNKADKSIPATIGNFAALNATGNLIDSTFRPTDFALASHTHTIGNVTGLQTAIDQKAYRSHLNAISEIFTSVDRTGMFDVGVGSSLTTVLAGKSDTTHNHALTSLSDVSISAPTVGQVVRWSGTAWTAQTLATGTPTLTSGQIAFGDGSNLMTSSADFRYTSLTPTLFIGNSTSSGRVEGFSGVVGGALTIKGGSTSSANAGGFLALHSGTGTPAGDVIIYTGVAERLRIASTGAWQLAGAAGTFGQVLTSTGSGTAPTWQTVSAGISEPNNQVVFGTGTSTDSSSEFIFATSTGKFIVSPAGSGDQSEIKIETRDGPQSVRAGFYASTATAGGFASNINITAGYGNPGTFTDGGHVGINAGDSDTIGGNVELTAGSTLTPTGDYGGNVIMRAGHGGDYGGAVEIYSGAGGTSSPGRAGDVLIQSGDGNRATPTSQTAGNIVLKAGGDLGSSNADYDGEIRFETGVGSIDPTMILRKKALWMNGSAGVVGDVLASAGPNGNTFWTPAAGYLFQVGSFTNASHYHYAVLTLQQAKDLIQTTDPALPVADPLQPSVVITSAENGDQLTHTHDLTVFFDYANHTFIVTNITNNPGNGTDPLHVAYMVGDGVGSGGGQSLLSTTVSLGTVISTFTMRTLQSEMTYYNVYEAANGGYMAPWTGEINGSSFGGFTMSQVAPKKVFIDDMAVSSNTSTGLTTIAAPDPENCMEIRVDIAPTPGNVAYYVGVYSNTGNTFDDTAAYGGSNRAVWTCDGTNQRIYGFGQTDVFIPGTWQVGDILGIVQSGPGTVDLYRNGTLIASPAIPAATDLYVLYGHEEVLA